MGVLGINISFSKHHASATVEQDAITFSCTSESAAAVEIKLTRAGNHVHRCEEEVIASTGTDDQAQMTNQPQGCVGGLVVEENSPMLLIRVGCFRSSFGKTVGENENLDRHQILAYLRFSATKSPRPWQQMPRDRQWVWRPQQDVALRLLQRGCSLLPEVTDILFFDCCTNIFSSSASSLALGTFASWFIFFQRGGVLVFALISHSTATPSRFSHVLDSLAQKHRVHVHTLALCPLGYQLYIADLTIYRVLVLGRGLCSHAGDVGGGVSGLVSIDS